MKSPNIKVYELFVCLWRKRPRGKKKRVKDQKLGLPFSTSSVSRSRRRRRRRRHSVGDWRWNRDDVVEIASRFNNENEERVISQELVQGSSRN